MGIPNLHINQKFEKNIFVIGFNRQQRFLVGMWIFQRKCFLNERKHFFAEPIMSSVIEVNLSFFTIKRCGFCWSISRGGLFSSNQLSSASGNYLLYRSYINIDFLSLINIFPFPSCSEKVNQKEIHRYWKGNRRYPETCEWSNKAGGKVDWKMNSSVNSSVNSGFLMHTQI